MIRKKSLYTNLIIIACILCNLTQIPILYDNRLLGIASTGIWIILALFMTIQEKTINLVYFVLPIFFDLYCITFYALKSGYISSDLFRPINLSTFILLIGIWAGAYLDEYDLKKISGAFIISAFLVSLYLYFDVFRGVDWAGSGVYLFSAKNSAGQIFLTAVILLVLFYLKKHRVISVMICIFFVVLIVMMKSRTTLLTMAIVLFYILLFVVEKPSYKVIGFSMILTTIIVILTNETLYDFWINKILFNNRETTDISGILSNRDIHYDYFKRYFGDFWLIGTGGTYLESLPLAALMSYGIIGGIPVLVYSIFPLYIGLKNVRFPEFRTFCTVIISLGLMMWINGIFEEQSPFGPGVKCYFLWLVTGLLIGYKKNSGRRR
nr:hypothetical protein [uncultured Sellimonas sp.]